MKILNDTPKNGISFNHRGTPIEPDLRPLWRYSLICLILFRLCTGYKASSKKIQTLYSVVASPKRRECYLNNNANNSLINIRFDPLINRAISFGITNNLFLIDKSTNIKLTEKGKKFSKQLDQDDKVFVVEKNFINQLKKSDFTNRTIDELILGEGHE